MSENAYHAETETLYAAPVSLQPDAAVIPFELAVAVAQEQDLCALIGSKAVYYYRRSTAFNWAASLLSGLWLAYRKMYKPAAIFYGLLLLEAAVEEVLIVGILGQAEPPVGVGLVVGLIAAFVCGTYGNRWYLAHARKVIAEIRAQESTTNRLKAGGL